MASLPYPRRPPNSFHRTHSKFVYASPPTEFTEYTEASGVEEPPTDFTEYTEASGGEEPPTDFTDVHRFFFSASRFCVFREFCGKIVWWLRRVLPRISQNTQKLLAEKSLLQMRTDTHRWLGCVGFCGNIVWWLRGYGRMPYPPNLCISVQSVGEYLASETSVGSVASVGR